MATRPSTCALTTTSPFSPPFVTLDDRAQTLVNRVVPPFGANFGSAPVTALSIQG
jgi:hypothetical protein